MKRNLFLLEHICVKTVWLIGMVIFGVFSYWAAMYTHFFSEELPSEKVSIIADSPARNFVFLLTALVLSYLVRKLILRGSEKKQRKTVFILTAAAVAAMGLCGCIWVFLCHSMPDADQLQVIYGAQEFSQGNFEQMGTYFYMYPQQYGLAFFYELIFFFCDSYRVLQYLNVLFLMMTVAFCVLTTEALFHNQAVNLYCLSGYLLLFPLLFYVNFVYGEMCSIAMLMTGSWCIIKWLDKGRHGYALSALLCVTVAAAVRKNSVIFLLALFIVLILYGIVKKSWKAALLAVLVLAVPIGGTKAIKGSYELRSGIRIQEGIPGVMWIAMGMQQSWNGAGVYNAYNNSTFWYQGQGDSGTTAAIGAAYIRERAAEFASQPQMAREFYQNKLLEQWNEASFGSLVMTAHFEQEPETLAQRVYYGSLGKRLLSFLNRYLFLIYTMVFFAAAAAFVKKPDILQCLMMVAVIGGVLFSILWEAKSRYVFPYIVMLIPYMASGLFLIQQGCSTGIRLMLDRAGKQLTRDKKAA